MLDQEKFQQVEAVFGNLLTEFSQALKDACAENPVEMANTILYHREWAIELFGEKVVKLAELTMKAGEIMGSMDDLLTREKSKVPVLQGMGRSKEEKDTFAERMGLGPHDPVLVSLRKTEAESDHEEKRDAEKQPVD